MNKTDLQTLRKANGENFTKHDTRCHEAIKKLEAFTRMYDIDTAKMSIEEQIAELMKEAGSKNRLEIIRAYGQYMIEMGVGAGLFIAMDNEQTLLEEVTGNW